MNKILIVDDTADNLTLLHALLSHNYVLKLKNTSTDVVEATTEFEPDLILLDIQMPGKSGFDVCKELKESSKLKDIPVIFMGLKYSNDDEIEGFELGAVDYISKPFEQGILLSRINVHIGLYRRYIEALDVLKMM